MKFSSMKLYLYSVGDSQGCVCGLCTHPEADPGAGTQNCTKAAQSAALACLHPIMSSCLQEHDIRRPDPCSNSPGKCVVFFDFTPFFSQPARV